MGRRSVKENKSLYQVTREELDLTREAAAERMTTISPERLERLENNKITMQPEDVLELSDAYCAPVLCNYYCSNDCGIGKRLGRSVEEKTLPQIAVDTFNSLNQLDAVKNRLLEIVGDGKVTSDEVQDFKTIRENLEKLSDTVESLRLWIRTEEAKGKLDLPE